MIPNFPVALTTVVMLFCFNSRPSDRVVPRSCSEPVNLATALLGFACGARINISHGALRVDTVMGKETPRPESWSYREGWGGCSGKRTVLVDLDAGSPPRM